MEWNCDTWTYAELVLSSHFTYRFIGNNFNFLFFLLFFRLIMMLLFCYIFILFVFFFFFVVVALWSLSPLLESACVCQPLPNEIVRWRCDYCRPSFWRARVSYIYASDANAFKSTSHSTCHNKSQTGSFILIKKNKFRERSRFVCNLLNERHFPCGNSNTHALIDTIT